MSPHCLPIAAYVRRPARTASSPRLRCVGTRPRGAVSTTGSRPSDRCRSVRAIAGSRILRFSRTALARLSSAVSPVRRAPLSPYDTRRSASKCDASLSRGRYTGVRMPAMCAKRSEGTRGHDAGDFAREPTAERGRPAARVRRLRWGPDARLHPGCREHQGCREAVLGRRRQTLIAGLGVAVVALGFVVATPSRAVRSVRACSTSRRRPRRSQRPTERRRSSI